MKKIATYKLLKELPMYPAGTIVTHEFETLPSMYNDGTYNTDGSWHTDRGVMASNYLESLIKWCADSQRTDDHHEEWVEFISLV